MQCLKNYIQIDGCAAPDYSYNVNGQPAPPSGLYINKDLPITLKSIDKVANEEQITFLGVWNEVQERALRKFRVRVKQGYRELFSQCIDDTWICTNHEALAVPLLYFLGSELMYERLISERINRYTTIDRDKAALMKADFDAEFQLQLKDALQIINDGQQPQNGDVFSYREVLP